MEEAKTTETQEQKEQPKRNKLTSAKLWVTLWAIGMVSFIVIANRIDFMTIAQPLCFIPLGYLGVNVWQKKIYKDKANDNSGLDNYGACVRAGRYIGNRSDSPKHGAQAARTGRNQNQTRGGGKCTAHGGHHHRSRKNQE